MKLEMPQQATPKEDVRKRKQEMSQQETPKEDVRPRKRPMPRKAEMKAAEAIKQALQLKIQSMRSQELKIQKAAARRWFAESTGQDGV